MMNSAFTRNPIVESVIDNTWLTTATTILTQDVIASNEIIVDTSVGTPIGTFQSQVHMDPNGNPYVECLTVIAPGSGGQSLVHVVRSSSSETGWAMNPVNIGTSVSISAVCSGVDALGNVQCFFSGTDSNQSANLFQMTLGADGVTWGAPTQIYAGNVAQLGAGYYSDGTMMAYGQDGSGNLVVVCCPENSATYAAVAYDVGNLSDGDSFAFAVTEDLAWTLAVVQNSAIQIYQGGTTGGTPSNNFTVDLPTGSTPATVSYGFYSQTLGDILFLVVSTTGELFTASASGAAALDTSYAGSANLASATAQIYIDGSGNEMIRVYGLDVDNGFWSLNLVSWNGATPVWAPWIPLASNLSQARGDMNYTPVPSIFTLDGSATLGLYVLDAISGAGQWRANPIRQSPSTVESAFEIVRYRCEFAVRDSNNNPMPNTTLNLSLGSNSSATEVSIAGASYMLVNSGTDTSVPIPVTSDAMGKVTVGILVSNSLNAPTLVLSTTDGSQSVQCQVNQGVQTYLGGTNTSYNATSANQLATFDAQGDALKAANYTTGVNSAGVIQYASLVSSTNSGNAGAAATAINTLATTAVPANQDAFAARRNSGPLPRRGFALVRDAGQVRLVDLPTDEAFESHLRTLSGREVGEELGSFWSDVTAFAADVYQGLCNGASKIASLTVDVANGLITLTSDLFQTIQVAIRCVDDLLQAIGAVLNAIGAAIESVIDWLKSLLDFAAIWRTKTSLQSMFTNLFSTDIPNAISTAETAFNTWITNLISDVDNDFTSLETNFGSQQLSGAKGYFAPGSTPSTSVQLSGGASTNDVGNNVNNNWLLDKIISALGSGGVSIPDWAASQITGSSSAFGAIDALINPNNPNYDASNQTTIDFLAFSSAVSDFMTNNLLSWLEAATDPVSQNFGNISIAGLLTGLQSVVTTALTLAQVIVDDIMSLATAACSDISALLLTEWDLGPLNAVWNWVAVTGGESAGDTLCMASLTALLLAVPVTLIYKAIQGVENEPFPTSGSTSQEVALVGQIIALIGHIPDFIAASDPAANVGFIRYWRTFTKVAVFGCVVFNQDILPFIENNPILALLILEIAILVFLAIANATSVKAIYSTVTECAAFIAAAKLAYAVYEAIEDSPSALQDTANLTDPLPAIINGFFPEGWVAEAEAGLYAAIACATLWMISGCASVVIASEACEANG